MKLVMPDTRPHQATLNKEVGSREGRSRFQE
jgi:hypothetical protein